MSMFEYIAQAYADYAAVRAGEKPLMIVSSGKSAFAVETLSRLAEEDGLNAIHERFTCEDGLIHTHVFICAAGAPYAYEAISAIWRNIERVAYDGWNPRRSREALQLELGLLLGYSAQECLDFMRSDIGRTCECDCCGGPETAELPALVTDGNPSRFVEYGYVY